MGGSSREGDAESVADDVLLDAHKEDDAIAMGWCSSRWGQRRCKHTP